MCEQVDKNVLFAQCRYLATAEAEPSSANMYDTYFYKFVYVELCEIDRFIIIESVSKSRNDIVVKRRVFPHGTTKYEAIRKAISVFDKLAFELDSFSTLKRISTSITD